MKYVLLAIFVLFAAQPLQASVCDRYAGQDTGHSQHGGMHDRGMNDMDCCDHAPADSGDNCASMPHCGACTAGFVAVNPSVSTLVLSSSSRQHPLAGNQPLSSFSPPPFRPPIA